MKHNAAIKVIVPALCALAVMAGVAGCTSVASSSSSSTDTQATANRQYMASLNQQVADMQTVLDDFQTAVSKKDTVGMNAQAQNIEKLIDAVKNTDATDRLKSVKDAYVDGLCTIDDALNAYTALYTDVQAGTVDDASYTQRLKSIQSAYDDGIAKLKSADDAVQGIANE